MQREHVSEADEADADSHDHASLQRFSSAESSRWVTESCSSPAGSRPLSDADLSGRAVAEDYDIGFGDACLVGPACAGVAVKDDEDDYDARAAAPGGARQCGSDLLQDLCTSASFRGLRGGEGMSMHNLCSWLEVAGTGLQPEHGRRAISFSTAVTSTGRTPGKRAMRSPTFSRTEVARDNSSPTTSRRAPTVAAAPISFQANVNHSRSSSITSSAFVHSASAPAPGLASNSLACNSLASSSLPVGHIAASALPLQPKLLRTMLGFKTPATLLHWISSNLSILDSINLVSALYRIARMFTDVRDSGEREALKQQLLQSSALQLLLRTILGHVLAMSRSPQADLEIRTLVNLVWSVVKLELANDPFSLGFELLHSSAPRVILLLPGCSAQGVGNLLWAYSKLEEQPEKVMLALVVHITETLVDNPFALDAQAISNSVWALAHNECKLALAIDEKALPNSNTYGPKTRNFLNATANGANELLHQLRNHRTSNGCAALLAQAEHQFSGQALSNIAWSIATLLADSIDTLPCLASLMRNIKYEALIRLRATSAALNEGTWLYKMPGGMNEQALSNLAFAFNKTGLLDADLLSCLLGVGEQHLLRPDRSKPAFKPSQLTTLLQAAMLPIARPQSFLKAVAAVLTRHSQLIRYWTTSELQDLESALMLLQPPPPPRLGSAFPLSQPPTPQHHINHLAMQMRPPTPQHSMQHPSTPHPLHAPQHLQMMGHPVTPHQHMQTPQQMSIAAILSHTSNGPAATQYVSQGGQPYMECMPGSATKPGMNQELYWSLDGMCAPPPPAAAAYGLGPQLNGGQGGVPAACMQHLNHLNLGAGGYGGPVPLPGMMQPQQMMFPMMWQVPGPWQMAATGAPFMSRQAMPCPSLRYDPPPMIQQYIPSGMMWAPPQMHVTGCPGFPFWAA